MAWWYRLELYLSRPKVNPRWALSAIYLRGKLKMGDKNTTIADIYNIIYRKMENRLQRINDRGKLKMGDKNTTIADVYGIICTKMENRLQRINEKI